jgi:hypothetical protein
VLGTWLTAGLVVDGWAHRNLGGLETFFTPWHALFYSGFTATAAWMGWQVLRAQDGGQRGRAAVPLGYGFGLVGVGVFVLGGVGDLLWHRIFGVEQSIDALFSPTHLLLFAGMALILTSPLRAAWAHDAPDAAPGYRVFLPVLLSMTLTVTLLSFFFMYWSPYLDGVVSADATRWARGFGGEAGLHLEDFLLIDGIATILVTNLFLTAPVLLLVRRWRLPFGSVATLFTVVAGASSAIGEFETLELVLAAAVSGLVVDLLIARLRPSAARGGAFRALGATLPVVVWGGYFVALALTAGIGWAVELWSGAIVWASLSGLALSLLMLPPPVPTGGGAAPADAGGAAPADAGGAAPADAGAA